MNVTDKPICPTGASPIIGRTAVVHPAIDGLGKGGHQLSKTTDNHTTLTAVQTLSLSDTHTNSCSNIESVRYITLTAVLTMSLSDTHITLTAVLTLSLSDTSHHTHSCSNNGTVR